jgi:hypothetical protein
MLRDYERAKQDVDLDSTVAHCTNVSEGQVRENWNEGVVVKTWTLIQKLKDVEATRGQRRK